ncbi:MAG: nicotinamide-nucleotide amidohydrolase family protein [Candidatus Krumholzibacteriales bacterium]
MKFKIMAVNYYRRGGDLESLSRMIRELGGELSGLSFLPSDSNVIAESVMRAAPGNDRVILWGDADPAAVMPPRSGFEAVSREEDSAVVSSCGDCEILFFPSSFQAGGILEFLKERPGRSAGPVMAVCGLDSGSIENRLAETLSRKQLEQISMFSPFPMINYLYFPSGSDSRSLDEAAGKLGSYLFSRETRSLSSVVLEILRERDMTLAVAESVTGGLLSSEIVSIPGASRVFMEGFITYSNESKVETLGIDPGLIRSSGAVSPRVCVEMALSAASIRSADYALSTTGIAGPGGATPEKNVGVCYIGLRTPDGLYCVPGQFAGGRENVRHSAAVSALDILRLSLLGFSDRLDSYKTALND